MKKILFLTYYQIDLSEGIWKKIESQVQAIRNIGFSVDFFYMDLNNIVYDNGIERKIIKSRFHHKYFFYLNVKDYLSKGSTTYDYVYIRKPHGGLFCLGLPFLVNYTKDSVNIIEIPTYPYLNEINNFKGKLLEYIFEVSKGLYIKNIDRIAYFGKPVETIWGIKAIGLSNGINTNKIKKIENIKSKQEDVFNIVAVANLSFWHGYDRILEGIKRYAGNINILFYIVGDLEPEYTRLKELVFKLEIENNVIFTGRLAEKELDQVFEVADICVDALGRHRSGNDYNSSIKSKEYCARGLPFIKSHIDLAFEKNFFIYQAAADDSPINIAELIEWRSRLPIDFSSLERSFAEEYLTWEKQFSKLLK